MEILVISSEEPLIQVLPKMCAFSLVFTKCSLLVFGLKKYINGTTPPINWLAAVAAAAPTIPQRKTATKIKSRSILATPAATVTARPSCGRSAVIRKL